MFWAQSITRDYIRAEWDLREEIYIVERTNEAQIRLEEQCEKTVVGRICGMKYSWKGHKDRKRHKNRLKGVGKFCWFMSGVSRNIPTTWRGTRVDASLNTRHLIEEEGYEKMKLNAPERQNFCQSAKHTIKLSFWPTIFSAWQVGSGSSCWRSAHNADRQTSRFWRSIFVKKKIMWRPITGSSFFQKKIQEAGHCPTRKRN